MLLFPVALAHHDIYRPGPSMALLSRMERHYSQEFWQPLGKIAFELRHSIGVPLAFAVKNYDGPQAIADAILNKLKNLFASLLNRHPVKVQPCLDRVLPMPELTEDAILNPWALPTEDVVRG